MGCVEGDGGLWMVKQGYRVEGSAVATLRDVRLFRCKRFEGIIPVKVEIGTYEKKGVFFRLRSYCFGSLYREGIKNKGNIIQQRKNRGKNIRFSMLKSYVI